MTHGKCDKCFRRYRSKASRELAENRAAIIADLKATASLKKHPDKHARHLLDSREYRQHG